MTKRVKQRSGRKDGSKVYRRKVHVFRIKYYVRTVDKKRRKENAL